MKIYIAGPYSKGDVEQNVKRAIDAADAVIALGHTPYLPHLTHFWHLASPKDYEYWLAYDKEWLPSCDAVLRLSGESHGADGEVTFAQQLGRRIFYDIREIPNSTYTTQFIPLFGHEAWSYEDANQNRRRWKRSLPV